MAVVGHGVDIIECDRVRRSVERYGEIFLNRILTDSEQQYVARKKDPVPHIAGRFAAKEAILKTIGTGWRGKIAWCDMEVLNDELGQPVVTLTGETARQAERRGIKRVLVSISHTKVHAIASAIGEDS